MRNTAAEIEVGGAPAHGTAAPLLPREREPAGDDRRTDGSKRRSFCAAARSAALVAVGCAVGVVVGRLHIDEALPVMATARPPQPSDSLSSKESLRPSGATLMPEVIPRGAEISEVVPSMDEHGFPDLSDVWPVNGSLVRWGICGPGRIARDFAAAIEAMGCTLHAVAAGSLPHALERARVFAAEYKMPHAYGTYEELAQDDEVDVVYIATTNHLHYRNAKLMLESGKHVLLEKPATISVQAFETLMRIARAKGVLLVTNFWTRWFPAVKWAESVVKSGILGPVVHVSGDMAFQAMRQRPARDRFDRVDLGGGAVLDMGCYLLQFAAMFLQGNASVGPLGYEGFSLKASGMVRNGVDMETAMIISAGDARAAFGTSLNRASDFALKVYCTHGVVRILPPANCPSSASYTMYIDAEKATALPTPCCGQPELATWTYQRPLPPYPQEHLPQQYPNGMGFVYVAAAVERCLYTKGCTELEEMPLDQQLSVVQMTASVLQKELGIFRDVKNM